MTQPRTELSAATVLVHAGRPDRTPDSPLSAPPVLASTYVEGGPMGYARTGNPTWAALEDVLGALEGGQGLAFASGMAAVAAVFLLARTAEPHACWTCSKLAAEYRYGG